jgi:hypothetical protein
MLYFSHTQLKEVAMITKRLGLLISLGLAALAFMGGEAWAFSSVSVTLSDYVTSQAAVYTITGSAIGTQLLTGDTITVTFPAGTVISSVISGAYVFVNGTAAATASEAGTVLTITTSADTSATDLTIQVTGNMIINAPTAGVTSLTLTTPYESGAGTYTLYAPTPTFTSTVTPTFTRTVTPTVTPTFTRTMTPTVTSTRTITVTSTVTPTFTITPTFTTTQSRTVTVSPTISPTITITVTPQSSTTVTFTVTITPFPAAANAIFSYPSPARGKEVWFYFNAAKPGHLELEFYNISGEKIGTLGTDLAQNGYGRLRWDLGSVAPGIYLYRARFLDTSGQGSWTTFQKMAVVK